MNWRARVVAFIATGFTQKSFLARCYWKPWSMPKDSEEPAIALRIGSTWARLPEELERIAFANQIQEPPNSSLSFRCTGTLNGCYASTVRHLRHLKAMSDAVKQIRYFLRSAVQLRTTVIASAAFATP